MDSIWASENAKKRPWVRWDEMEVLSDHYPGLCDYSVNGVHIDEQQTVYRWKMYQADAKKWRDDKRELAPEMERVLVNYEESVQESMESKQDAEKKRHQAL